MARKSFVIILRKFIVRKFKKKKNFFNILCKLKGEKNFLGKDDI